MRKGKISYILHKSQTHLSVTMGPITSFIKKGKSFLQSASCWLKLFPFLYQKNGKRLTRKQLYEKKKYVRKKPIKEGRKKLYRITCKCATRVRYKNEKLYNILKITHTYTKLQLLHPYTQQQQHHVLGCCKNVAA